MATSRRASRVSSGSAPKCFAKRGSPIGVEPFGIRLQTFDRQRNSRWADVAVRQVSYADCRARPDRRSLWAEAVRVLRLRPLGLHSQRSPEPGLSMVRVSLQRVRSEGRTHGWPGCLALAFGHGAARTRDSRTCRPRCQRAGGGRERWRQTARGARGRPLSPHAVVLLLPGSMSSDDRVSGSARPVAHPPPRSHAAARRCPTAGARRALP